MYYLTCKLFFNLINLVGQNDICIQRNIILRYNKNEQSNTFIPTFIVSSITMLLYILICGHF